MNDLWNISNIEMSTLFMNIGTQLPLTHINPDIDFFCSTYCYNDRALLHLDLRS